MLTYSGKAATPHTPALHLASVQLLHHACISLLMYLGKQQKGAPHPNGRPGKNLASGCCAHRMSNQE